MIGALQGTVYTQIKRHHAPIYDVNQKVRLKQRPQPYRISAVYRVENFFAYRLVEIQGALFEEDVLTPIKEEGQAA